MPFLEECGMYKCMSTTSSILRFLDKISPPAHVQAHCDVPCGVYETDSMSWAVETCMKLVEKLQALEMPPSSDKAHFLEHQNTLTRTVMIKEQFAQICKEQILILWTDYFKPEHLQKWPELHEKVWKAAKQCSVVKRTVSVDEVKKLKTLTDEIAQVFKDSKK